MLVLEICQVMDCYIFLNNRNDILTLNLTYVIIYKNSVQDGKPAGVGVRFDGNVREISLSGKDMRMKLLREELYYET